MTRTPQFNDLGQIGVVLDPNGYGKDKAAQVALKRGVSKHGQKLLVNRSFFTDHSLTNTEVLSTEYQHRWLADFTDHSLTNTWY